MGKTTSLYWDAPLYLLNVEKLLKMQIHFYVYSNELSTTGVANHADQWVAMEKTVIDIV